MLRSLATGSGVRTIEENLTPAASVRAVLDTRNVQPDARARQDCRTNRPNSGKPFTNSSVTAPSFRDANCASSFAVAGRASSLASAHSAFRWQPEI
jgi:hypothetical protein